VCRDGVVINDFGNAGSIGDAPSLGFEPAGAINACGWS
jgi:hypothetical protein